MTEKASMRRNAIIATVAGVALLASGGTYALWTATANIDGGTITTGNLNLTAGTSNVWDVSADRSDVGNVTTAAQAAGADTPAFTATTLTAFTGEPALQGHLIDNLADSVASTDWKMVPGDTVALVYPFEVELAGDNLVASLSFPMGTALMGTTTPALNAATDITYAYQMFDGTGKALSVRKDVKDASAASFVASYFQATPFGQDAGTADGDIPIIGTESAAGNTAQMTLALYVTFDKDVTEKVDQDTVLAMADNLQATLSQVRCGDAETLGNFAACASN
ncbi:MAG: SipW-dependent-type signal peptide-containing protein [Propionibacteriaceae bacterium]|jgi:alternate signal-mediated exported protein|nr:SipW-dependent-type signal peptide-containing protein [Propionibacteriaceae bacterium]